MNTAPTPGITGSSTICPGQSASLSANTSYSSYAWSTGGTTQSISVSTAATYTLTVTDANGCTNTSSISVSNPGNITASVTSQTNVSCNGGSNGAIDLSVTGGTTAYAVIFVEVRGKGSAGEHKRVYLDRQLPAWPTL